MPAFQSAVRFEMLENPVNRGKGYSVREVIRTVEEVSAKKVPVKEGPRRAGDPAELVACADKVRRELGWTPRYAELRPIVETAWGWHAKHPRGYNDRKQTGGKP